MGHDPTVLTHSSINQQQFTSTVPPPNSIPFSSSLSYQAPLNAQYRSLMPPPQFPRLVAGSPSVAVPGENPLSLHQNSNPGISLALKCDSDQLSEYQILVRQQLEIFEASEVDVSSNTQGRKKQIFLGQVGIRCRHCAPFPLRERGKGAVYYPTKLEGVYQASQVRIPLDDQLLEVYSIVI